MPISFSQIPGTLRTPGVFFEADPSHANNDEQDQLSVIAGQMLNTGSRTITVATNAATTANSTNNTLQFAAASAIANLIPGAHVYVIDRTVTAATAQGTTVVSKTTSGSNTTVTLSAPIANSVGSGDSIEFADCSPVLVNSQNQVNTLFGRGSQIAAMYGYYRGRDNFGELWAAPFPDDPAGVAATAAMVIAGTVSQTATLYVYANGVKVPVVVTSAMSTTQIATAVAAAINAATDPVTGSLLTMTAASSSGTVTATARNAGAFGNDMDLRLNYLGPKAGEVTPAGLTVQIGAGSGTPAFSGGANNASTGLTNALNNLPSYPWGFVAQPYSDTASLNAVQTFMDDIAGQWAWSAQKYGGAFGAIAGTLGALQTAGAARNDQHMSLMGAYRSPTPPYAVAAIYTADVAATIRANPAASLDSTVLTNWVPPAPADRFHTADQNTLLWSGIATYDVSPAGAATVNKAITTYQLNTSGDPDDSYLDVELLYKLGFSFSFSRIELQSWAQGANLVEDGTRIGAGLKFVSPSTAKAKLVEIYGQLMNLGIVEDIDDFEKNVIVEINETNANRLDILWPGVIVKNLDIIAVLGQFRNGVTGS